MHIGNCKTVVRLIPHSLKNVHLNLLERHYSRHLPLEKNYLFIRLIKFQFSCSFSCSASINQTFHKHSNSTKLNTTFSCSHSKWTITQALSNKRPYYNTSSMSCCAPKFVWLNVDIETLRNRMTVAL